MATFTEPARIGDLLKREYEPLYNRESITVVSGQNLLLGAVLGRITASGKYTAYNPAAADGSETAAAVLLFPVDASAADAPGVILARGPAVVAKSGLAWGAGVTTDSHKTAAYAALEAKSIVSRADVFGSAFPTIS